MAGMLPFESPSVLDSADSLLLRTNAPCDYQRRELAQAATQPVRPLLARSSPWRAPQAPHNHGRGASIGRAQTCSEGPLAIIELF